jgi:hypothetical protein
MGFIGSALPPDRGAQTQSYFLLKGSSGKEALAVFL